MLLADYRVQQRELRNASDADKQAARQTLRRDARDDYLAAVNARLASALDTPAPFVERLVHFWANHFAVSVDKPVVLGLAGPLEFEAIRPHVLGRFDDMLLAVERHPAMLLYLDQAQSIGPDSLAARRAAEREPQRQRGLNENLAREILELHTLGVRSGYTPGRRHRVRAGADRLERGGRARAAGSRACRRRRRPLAASSSGPRCTSPARAPCSAAATPRAARRRRRRSCTTSPPRPRRRTHIATKLARHFAGDDPPPALVERLEPGLSTQRRRPARPSTAR